MLGGKNLQKHVVGVIPTTLVMIAVKDETGFRLRLWMRFLLIASDSRQLSFPLQCAAMPNSQQLVVEQVDGGASEDHPHQPNHPPPPEQPNFTPIFVTPQ